jgi:hypothetical protein
METFMHTHTDWKDYFKRKLTSSGTWLQAAHNKQGVSEIYTSVDISLRTTIEVGYESPRRLLFLHILSSFTPGMNKRQEHYSFDPNDIYPHFEQNGRGLEFDHFNLRGIDQFLSEGLKGSEIIYLLNGKPVKSVLKSNVFPYSQDIFTYYFKKEFPVLLNSDKSEKETSFDQTIKIDLRDVFPGTEPST